MQLSKYFLPVLVSGLCFTSPVHAASKAHAVTMTLGAGYEYFASKRHLDNRGYPLAMLGYNITEHWGIEGLYGNFSTNSNQGVDNGQTVKGTLLLFDGLYHFKTSRALEPFLLAGVGATGLSPNGNDARNQGNINAGVGCLLFANDRAAFRFEARDIYTIVGGKNDVMLDGGATFQWDV